MFAGQATAANSGYRCNQKKVWVVEETILATSVLFDCGGYDQVANIMMKHNKDKPVVVLNMMFHNIEVVPGLSPYTQSDADVTRYLDSMKGFFEFCSRKNVQPATLSKIHQYYCTNGRD
jgi:hypothetical protein